MAKVMGCLMVSQHPSLTGRHWEVNGALLLVQGVPGLVDAVPVTSPPVAGGSGPRSGGGFLQQAERTRAEETLRVSTGGNSSSFPLPQGAQVGTWWCGCPQPQLGPFPFPQAPAGKAKRGRRGNVARKATQGPVASQGQAVSRVKRWVRAGL